MTAATFDGRYYINQGLSIGLIPPDNVRSIHDGESAIELLQHQNVAPGESRSPRRRLNLQNHVSQPDGVVVIDRAFMLNRKDTIQIQRARWNKRRSRLRSGNRETAIEPIQILLPKQRVRRFQGRDIAKTQFLSYRPYQVRKLPSPRPRACGEYAAIISIPSSFIAGPTWVSCR